MKLTGQLTALVSPHSGLSPSDLKDEKCLGSLVFWKESMVAHATKQGYTKVGVATITVEMADEKTIVGNKIEALREEAKSLRAETTAKCTRIEAMIQNLLALEDGTNTKNIFSPSDESDIPF